MHIPHIRLQTYAPGDVANNSAKMAVDVQNFARMTIGSTVGVASVNGGGIDPQTGGTGSALTPTNGVYDLTNIDMITFALQLDKYNGGVGLANGWADANIWRKATFSDIYLY